MTARGFVAMAAYEPDPVLFTRQIRSIQNQTVDDFVCVISADSDPEPIARLVQKVTHDDLRFSVISDGERRGFYLNFERALSLVPAGTSWVALSDQDDYWYPDKLERLLPWLDSVALVSCQSRVVRHPEGTILLPSTRRRGVPFDDLLVQNQITGAQTIFRAQLLKTALPFPRVRSVTAVHDHWLAVCAAALGGYEVVDDVLQDYVQHAQNVIGEVSAQPMDVLGAVRRIAELAVQYEGSRTPRAMATVTNRLAFGWRRAMLRALIDRVGHVPPATLEAWRAFSPDHSAWSSLSFLSQRLRSANVDRGTVFTFLPGLVLELAKRSRLE